MDGFELVVPRCLVGDVGLVTFQCLMARAWAAWVASVFASEMGTAQLCGKNSMDFVMHSDRVDKT